MQQLQKLSPFNHRNRQQLANIKQSQSDKLQRLWDKLQDLSEVQDESRNQQMPIFLDDQSVISKHSENDSFLNTVKILDQSPHKINKSTSKDKIQLQPQKHIETQQLKIGKYVQTKIRNICSYSQSFAVSPCYVQSFAVSPCYVQSYGKSLEKQNTFDYVFSCRKQQPIKMNNLNFKSQSKQCLKNRQGEEGRTQNRIKQMNEINEKLVSDNKKLFNQCIKLRKLTQRYQNQQKQITKELFFDPKDKIKMEQNQKLIQQQLQKLQKLELQNKNLNQRQKNAEIQNLQLRQYQKSMKIKQYENRERLEGEIRQTLQTEIRQKLQKVIKQRLEDEIQKKFATKIKELEHTINLKQKQLIDTREKQLIDRNQRQLVGRRQSQIIENDRKYTQMSQRLQYKRLEIQLQEQKRNKQTLLRQLQQMKLKVIELQSLKQFNAPINSNRTIQIIQNPLIESQNSSKSKQGPLIYNQKNSRASSIKSTTMSLNGSVFDKSSNHSGNVQSLLRDKERQITNIKVVHESEIKKYKETINDLQQKLRITNN